MYREFSQSKNNSSTGCDGKTFMRVFHKMGILNNEQKKVYQVIDGVEINEKETDVRLKSVISKESDEVRLEKDVGVKLLFLKKYKLPGNTWKLNENNGNKMLLACWIRKLINSKQPLNNTKQIGFIEEIKNTTVKWYYVRNFYNKVR